MTEDLADLINNFRNIHKDLRQISTDKIVVSEWVRFKCRYGCPSYGQRLSCPPFSPTPEETRRLLAEYKVAVIIHSQTKPEPSWTPDQYRQYVRECRAKLHTAVIDMERAAFFSGYYKAFAMGSTPCSLCETCVIKEKPDASGIQLSSTLDCRHKDIMRPPMDAFGIDMFETAKNAGYNIKVLKSYSDTADLFAMVLVV